MPDDIQKVIEKEQQTQTGISVSGGEIVLNDFDEVSWETLRKDYDTMVKDTPAIKTSLNLILYPIFASKKRIDVGESGSELAKEARDYIDYCWENIEDGFVNNIKHNAQAIHQGLQLHEKIIKKGDNYKIVADAKTKKKLTNRIIKYSPIQNKTIQKFHYNTIGKFSGITHTREINNVDGSIKIDFVKLYEGEEGIKNINDLFSVYSYDSLYNDVRGNSILRPARLYWECLRKTIIGRTVNIQRGTGLVMGKYKMMPSTADINKFEKMAKNLNALHGDNFIWFDESKLSVELADLKGQAEVMAFIEFLYKQILMTMLTQFISIGMGQVGAYNAGESQKSPFELALAYHMEDFKRFYQKETEYMIDISYLSGLAKEDMPIFEFESPAQTDLLKTSQILLNFRNMGVTFSTEEIEYIKRLLPFIPEKPIEVTTDKTLQPEGETDVQDDIDSNLKVKLKQGRNIKPDILEFESAVFEKNAVEEHYLTIEEKADNIILKTIKEMLAETKEQVKSGFQRIHIGNWHAKDLEEKLYQLFETGYNRGQADVKKEVKKVQSFKTLKIKQEALELKLSDSTSKKFKKILSINVEKLLNKVKTTVDYDMASLNEKQLSAMGGVDGYFSGKEEEFKQSKRELIQDTTTGYTSGRNDMMNDVSTDDTEFLYTSIMDKNLCDHCSQWDGLTFMKSEIEASKNFSLSGSSVNLDCLGLLGNNKCRCTFIIFG